MRITIYRTELDENQHNILVKESGHNYPDENLSTPEAVVNMLNSVFSFNKRSEEYLIMIALNTKNKVLGVFEISHGTVNRSLCNPREIFIKALLCGAVNIILAHNHPSGDPTLSHDDREVYWRVKRTGDLIGINLIDNIVIGGNKSWSFSENGF